MHFTKMFMAGMFSGMFTMLTIAYVEKPAVSRFKDCSCPLLSPCPRQVLLCGCGGSYCECKGRHDPSDLDVFMEKSGLRDIGDGIRRTVRSR